MSLKSATSEPSVVTSDDTSKELIPCDGFSAPLIPSQSLTFATMTAEDSDCRHDCVICLDAICETERLVRFVACNHYYHTDCIQEWLRTNISCPICRHLIPVCDNPFYNRPDVEESDDESEELAQLLAFSRYVVDNGTDDESEAEAQEAGDGVEVTAQTQVSFWSEDSIDYICEFDRRVRMFLEMSDEDDLDDPEDANFFEWLRQ